MDTEEVEDNEDDDEEDEDDEDDLDVVEDGDDLDDDSGDDEDESFDVDLVSVIDFWFNLIQRPLSSNKSLLVRCLERFLITDGSSITVLFLLLVL